MSSVHINLIVACIAWLSTNTAITYQSTGQRPDHDNDVSNFQHDNDVTKRNFSGRSKIILIKNKDSKTVLVSILGA